MKTTWYPTLAFLLALGAAVVPTPSGSAWAQSNIAANQMVVVKASSGAFEQGQIIDGGQTLKLESGASVTLIGPNGSMVTLTGPYEKIPAADTSAKAKNPNVVKALGALLSGRKYSTASLGVVRAAKARSTDELPDPWLVSIEDSGSRCIRPDIVVLWRSDSSNESTLTISRANANLTAQAQWAEGDNVLPLASRRFNDGGLYTVEIEGRQEALTMHVLPVEFTEIGEQAAWMAQSGCNAQALALLDAVG